MRLLLALVLGCAACGAPDAEDAEVAGDALNNGQGTASHPEVGRLELKGSALGEEHLTHCVGTLVSPTVVLTSRACSFGDLIEAGGTFFIDRDSDGDGKVDATNAFAVKYQDALTHSATGNASRRGRFAFVKLEKAVPASVATPAVLRKAALSDDEKVVAVGFGDTSEDWGAKTTASFVLRYVTVRASA